MYLSLKNVKSVINKCMYLIVGSLATGLVGNFNIASGKTSEKHVSIDYTCSTMVSIVHSVSVVNCFGP